MASTQHNNKAGTNNHDRTTMTEQRLFVLDTNVLMHDPTSIFRFHEHHIFLPMVVLEELDKAKKGVSEVARNVRQVSRFLDELMSGASKQQIDAGLPLPAPENGKSDTTKEPGHPGRTRDQDRLPR